MSVIHRCEIDAVKELRASERNGEPVAVEERQRPAAEEDRHDGASSRDDPGVLAK